MATQVQIRGSVAATQEARTLATRELDVNTTDKRISVHDGSTTGGIPHPNYVDIQNQEYTYGAASGTDTITVSMAKAPGAYIAGQRFTFKAAATNTGSATLNVNSLGAKTIKKKDVAGGTIAALSAGDIISGGIYTVFYDGTDMLLEAVDGGGLQSVSQGDLNTSTGTFSASPSSIGGSTFTGSGDNLKIAAGSGHIITPGGQYGFMIESRNIQTGRAGGWIYCNDSTSFVAGLTAYNFDASLDDTVHGQQRYITSSPPFDMGDGEVGGFIFLLLNSAGDIVSHYAADVPPWGYNGPTNIRADKIHPITKEKYRRVMKERTLEEIMDGARIEYEYQEITQAIKNADMGLLPHPFGAVPPGHTVVMLDPMDEKIRNLIEYQNAGGGDDVVNAIHSGKYITMGDKVQRKAPKGVGVFAIKQKKTAR